jgi:hypothetical protein
MQFKSKGLPVWRPPPWSFNIRYTEKFVEK